ncbi:flagellar hook-associated protein 2 [Priestia abyssalis]|uniref:flagellar hook-associated protein 2 n=1 Tax=Priestia abyssalis TaxID=1221450 RepID=UPI00099490AE|nr:flagellar hook-associated protein 2 [Priestia abyssalis]
MRIGGLASGMDTNQIISDLMKAERIPLDKLIQKKQLLEWQRDDYRNMNKALAELDTVIFDGVFKQSAFLKKTLTSSDNSKVTATALNASANTTSTVEVIDLAKSATWKTTGAVAFAPPASGSLSFVVKDPDGTAERTVNISLAPTDTVDDFVAKINGSNLGVTAMNQKIYDEVSKEYKDTIVFSNNKTGAGGYINITDSGTKTFMTNLGFQFNGDTLTTDPLNRGTDAVVKINGYQMQQKSNNFTLNGINYTLKNKTNTGEAISISTSTDVDGIFDMIKKFVDKYNEVISKINGELKEERYRDFAPLTDEQKEAMEEKEIDLWEEKAKSGMLRNDSILSGGLSQMRSDLYAGLKDGTAITAGFSQLAEIGITTSSNYLDRGKLVIDETKLREKIQENPTAVYELFNHNGTTSESKGIARRLRDTIKNTIGKVEERAGNSSWTNQQFSLGRNLSDIAKSMDRYEDRLTKIEDRYWRQFTAMEKAVQQANTQSSYLMQQFSGGV